MTRYLLLLLTSAALPLVVVVAQGNANDVPDYRDCKAYDFCCDNMICTNNCHLWPREECEEAWGEFTQVTGANPTTIKICTDHFQYVCCRSADGCGDPHFRTWNGDWFDFHGECDLKLVSAPGFASGMGLDIHVRTKIRNDFSYIEAAAIKIGKDVFELGGWGEYVVNGVDGATLPKEVGSFPINHTTIDEATHNYHIYIGEHQSLLIKSFKDYVSVKFENAASSDFLDSKGLLGDFLTGKMIARDGVTEMTDPIDYGMEWQVRPEEPQLFQSNDVVPQYPDKCRMPDMEAQGRRLAESTVLKEDAEQACAHLEDVHQRLCIYDVMATGELGMAQAGTY